jgi:ABC-type Fe3+/spermidine/putrescine transport system ATPase subunit
LSAAQELGEAGAAAGGGDVAAPAAKLRVEGLRFRYRTTEALAGVDLAIAEGEFVSVLGPSGCGKTTLLRVVAGLLAPDAGRVFLSGRDITHLRPERRPLNMVFQHLALFPHLSVVENVAFGLRFQGQPKRIRSEKAGEMLDLVGLAGFERRSTHQLSGGQQQRVALARALVTEPEILLLDEPLGSLDFTIRKEMQAELKAIQRRLHVTFVFVTHDQTEAMAMSDRVILMRAGAIVQDASPVETYVNPVDAFAASFVGETNLLQGVVESVDAGLCSIRIGDAGVTVAAPDAVAAGAHVAVSIRPEHITLRPAGEPATVPGRVESESFVGPEVLGEVSTPIGLLKTRESAVRVSVGRLGDEVGVEVDGTRARVFLLDA